LSQLSFKVIASQFSHQMLNVSALPSPNLYEYADSKSDSDR